MITARNLTKRYGATTAVDDLSFDIKPGVVTGFLGPNGAGKSTTMRMILGLDTPTSGAVTVGGKSYRDLPAPVREVGALLDAKAVHGARTAYRHLQWVAQAGGIPRRRVGEVLDLAGLAKVAGKKVGSFSLGMYQRLGIATALLGDPPVLLFDEPVNGLDPEGILWIRTLMRDLATEGRTVFVSSHLMNEMEETAGHVVVIGRGTLIADMPIEEFTRSDAHSHVHVVSPHADELARVLTDVGAAVTRGPAGSFDVTGLDAAKIGDLALEHRLGVHELTPVRASLETAFMDLTRESVQYRPTAPGKER
ncbi:ABC transporter ATP-binding protein [Kibdelosporangium phytohabitans]|uniref:Multidrug ABC transporter ATP-binding protein n=1 Tax=Kibdelosporangium phytohabitans TaxID=860235 RepID=A0A0N9I6R6_9PSEU|nr:ATP-binding cassette domain-containing protein [Kibdelosporangium phytohabitans]ALG10590.1 multidrug ABC transporter ATP-binding protein [Kibdelosporangium phytohabitans]MBE1461697.1 ABC-2 type transport system ATP-binding protein [Kibdelosporangium phytohabitans]